MTAKFNAPKIECERRGHVGIWWFSPEFSQSRFGDRNTGSNACTLIALLVAHKVYTQDIKIWGYDDEPLNKYLVFAFGESILEGNEIHGHLLRKGALRHVNMTVPEAVQAAGNKMRFIEEWKSLIYLMDLGETLYEQMQTTVREFNRNPPPRKGSDLYVILIADNRSVLLIFQKELDKVTLIDSHQHLQHGAVIAQVATDHLDSLCSWYGDLLQSCYGARPECYELSYLYFKRYEAGEMAS